MDYESTKTLRFVLYRADTNARLKTFVKVTPLTQSRLHSHIDLGAAELSHIIVLVLRRAIFTYIYIGFVQ